MATGDIQNNLRRLQRALRQIHYGSELDTKAAKDGDPSAFLPLIHYALLVYSHPFSVDLTERGYELYAKSDLRFMEGVYKVMREVLNYSPRINRQQFFQKGFAELKMIMTVELIEEVLKRHKQLMRQSKLGLRRLSGKHREYVEQVLSQTPDTSQTEKPYDSSTYTTPPSAPRDRPPRVSFRDTISFVSSPRARSTADEDATRDSGQGVETGQAQTMARFPGNGDEGDHSADNTLWYNEQQGSEEYHTKLTATGVSRPPLLSHHDQFQRLPQQQAWQQQNHRGGVYPPVARTSLAHDHAQQVFSEPSEHPGVGAAAHGAQDADDGPSINPFADLTARMSQLSSRMERIAQRQHQQEHQQQHGTQPAAPETPAWPAPPPQEQQQQRHQQQDHMHPQNGIGPQAQHHSDGQPAVSQQAPPTGLASTSATAPQAAITSDVLGAVLQRLEAVERATDALRCDFAAQLVLLESKVAYLEQQQAHAVLRRPPPPPPPMFSRHGPSASSGARTDEVEGVPGVPVSPLGRGGAATTSTVVEQAADLHRQRQWESAGAEVKTVPVIGTTPSEGVTSLPRTSLSRIPDPAQGSAHAQPAVVPSFQGSAADGHQRSGATRGVAGVGQTATVTAVPVASSWQQWRSAGLQSSLQQQSPPQQQQQQQQPSRLSMSLEEELARSRAVLASSSHSERTHRIDGPQIPPVNREHAAMGGASQPTVDAGPSSSATLRVDGSLPRSREQTGGPARVSDETAWERLFKSNEDGHSLGQSTASVAMTAASTAATLERPASPSDSQRAGAAVATPPRSPYRLFKPPATSSPKRRSTRARTSGPGAVYG